MPFFLTVAILHVLPLNALLSYRCIRDPRIERTQKALQLLVVWLIPFLGALLIWFLRRWAYSNHPPESSEWRNPPFEPDEDIPHE